MPSMTPNEPMHLIVIGASAGGIEALGDVLGGLPRDFPAPIVIAQHIDPGRPSHLPEILDRRGALQVQLITGCDELRPGMVFVVPPNRDVEVTNDHVMLREDGAGRPKPSVNRLFSSAAGIFGEALIAVVLSGTGSDGAVGARAVKEQGGMVIIQNPSTAKYSGMPASLSPSIVDIVADADRIGPLLNDLVSGTYVAAPPKSDRQLQPLLEKMRERAGIDFSMYKMATIQRRLKRRMAVTETRTLAEYAAYLETHPEEYDRLVSAFLIKVTEFF